MSNAAIVDSPPQPGRARGEASPKNPTLLLRTTVAILSTVLRVRPFPSRGQFPGFCQGAPPPGFTARSLGLSLFVINDQKSVPRPLAPPTMLHVLQPSTPVARPAVPVRHPVFFVGGFSIVCAHRVTHPWTLARPHTTSSDVELRSASVLDYRIWRPHGRVTMLHGSLGTHRALSQI